jgi:hypothetical protein
MEPWSQMTRFIRVGRPFPAFRAGLRTVHRRPRAVLPLDCDHHPELSKCLQLNTRHYGKPRNPKSKFVETILARSLVD